MEERFVFNPVADLCDRARAGYPEALFDDVVTAALSPGDAMLEIGAGTGKATEGFARQGLDIVTLEPGGEMIGGAAQDAAFHRRRRDRNPWRKL
jgi:hypothetical protein